ncbi:hypothetical protein B0O80DRAFT_109108 [Mortierella sp. GBAus27b]|nr:hypothetical protein B0O80DRAFT_109108 [Mortierella sp. GBAus27b]
MLDVGSRDGLSERAGSLLGPADGLLKEITRHLLDTCQADIEFLDTWINTCRIARAMHKQMMAMRSTMSTHFCALQLTPFYDEAIQGTEAYYLFDS